MIPDELQRLLVEDAEGSAANTAYGLLGAAAAHRPALAFLR